MQARLTSPDDDAAKADGTASAPGATTSAVAAQAKK
jgi:hypothetical protein